jgi:hypothetical protein
MPDGNIALRHANRCPASTSNDPGFSLLLPPGAKLGKPFGPLLLWPGPYARPQWVIGR